MPIKDKIVGNLIKYILIPRNEIIDQSGFIINKISLQKEITNLREILFPETIFINLEDRIAKYYKDKGKKILYSSGKKFTYRYGLISKYPTAKDGKTYLNFVYFLVRYLEAVLSSKMEYFIDVKEKIFRLKMWDYVVCNKNGLGIILADGSAGLISYAFSDPTMEGAQIKCQGRGDKYCELVCTTRETLKKMKLKFLTETNLDGLELENSYNNINAIRETEYSKTSFKDLIDDGFFTQRTGIIKHKDERFLLLESSMMYILENELKKLKGADKILFDISFNCGKDLFKKENITNKEKFVTDFFGALGFGDTLVLKRNNKYSIIFNYFPWTKWADKINFAMVRGLISGILSTDRKVILKKVEKDLSRGFFRISFQE